jgi:hypothetical protein
VLFLGDLQPIILLSVVSNIVEMVIFRQFTMYLNSREFFDQKQSGFRARLGKKDSSWKAVAAGLPQGSVGGSFLSLLMICQPA